MSAKLTVARVASAGHYVTMTTSRTIGDLIRDHADERPDKVALIQNDYSRTYRELHDESSQP